MKKLYDTTTKLLSVPGEVLNRNLLEILKHEVDSIIERRKDYQAGLDKI